MLIQIDNINNDTNMTQNNFIFKRLYQTGYLGLFFCLSLGIVLPAADLTMVATVMPKAIEELGGVAYLHWSQMLFDLGSIITGAACGLLTLRFGIKRAMLFSAVLLAIGCFISVIAPNMPAVMVGRLVQGLASGALTALVVISIEHLFPSNLLSGAIALTSSLWSVAAFTSPLISGMLVEWLHWRFGFVFIGVGALLMIPLWWRLEFKEQQAEHDPFPKMRLVMLSIALIIIALSAVASDLSLSLLTLIMGCLVLLWFFFKDYFVQIKDKKYGFFPHECLNLSYNSGRLFYILLLLSMVNISYTVYGPLLMMLHFDVNAVTAGLMVALESIGWTTAAIIFTSWSQEFGRKIIPYCVFTNIFALTMMGVSFYENIFWLLIPGALLSGACYGGCFGFMFVDICDGVDDKRRRLAASGITALQLMGFAIGASLAAMIINHFNFHDQGLSGFNKDNSIGSLLLFIGFIPLLLLCFWLSLKKVSK